MSDISVKLFRSLAEAKKINHYYYLYTDGDELRGTEAKVRVENLIEVIRAYKGVKKINRIEVDVDAPSIRGFLERYGDHCDVYVRKNMSCEWKRFTCVKEMCHILNDVAEDFSTDALQAIDNLWNNSGLSITKNVTPEYTSEKIAEIIALELIYPLEIRKADREKLDSNAITIEELVDLRGVPSPLIQAGTDAGYNDLCQQIWNLLPNEQPAPLTFDV